MVELSSLDLLVELVKHVFALKQHFEPQLLGPVVQNGQQRFHLGQLVVLGRVPSHLQLADHLVEKGDVAPHLGQLSRVRIHSENGMVIASV